MFERIINSLRKRSESKFDPSVFNDPAALKTEWSPLARGGANFKTHKLVQVYAGRYEFRPGLFMLLFASVFAMFGIGFASVSSFVILSSEKTPVYAVSAAMTGFGLLFALIGILIYRFASVPRVFDKDSGYYWKGRKEPELLRQSDNKNCVRLIDIAGVQIVSEYVRNSKSSYTSYELNLILKDGKRLNVTDHGNYEAIVKDAETIGQFLNVPVWNAAGR